MRTEAAVHRHPPRAPAPTSTRAYERAAGIFRAAGDVERLRLLRQLAHGEHCVTELAEAAGAAMSTVSQRLGVLRAQGLVQQRRAGKHIYYALADRHVADLIEAALEHAGEDLTMEGADDR